MLRQDAFVLDPEETGCGGQNQELRGAIIEALKRVQDPEIPMNFVDLGLIYGVAIGAGGIVTIDMTLTTPTCPVAGTLPAQVQNVVSLVPGVNAVIVNLVWDPPWTSDRMSAEAKLELGLL